MRYKNITKNLLVLATILFACSTANAQQVNDLYQGNVPGSKQITSKETLSNGIAFKVIHPTLTSFLPTTKTNKTPAVIVCPGGGYGALMMQAEGFATATYFQQHGVAAFVLKYRLPDDSTAIDKTTAPLQDAQQAMILIRQHATEWNIDTSLIGIMGFSAGGHLAATALTHFDKPVLKNTGNVNLRPAFGLLVYPVISMSDTLGHRGSRDNLLGKNPSAETKNLYSNELQVTNNTPPCFLIHSADDKVVEVDNSIEFFEALRHQKVPVEMHIYPKGDHGFILNWPIDDWMSLCIKWMQKSGFVK